MGFVTNLTCFGQDRCLGNNKARFLDVKSVMLHAAGTWAMTVATLNHLQRNDHATIRWFCNVKANDEVS